MASADEIGFQETSIFQLRSN